MVSKDEWKEIRRLLNSFVPVTLQADDYKLTIKLESCGDTRFFFAVYVNDEKKPEWTALSWEVSEKFYNRHKHVSMTPKQKRYIQRHSSESEELVERMTEHSYSPYWRSFDRLKNHLERKCDDLHFIRPDEEIIAEIPVDEFFSDDFPYQQEKSEDENIAEAPDEKTDKEADDPVWHKGFPVAKAKSRALLEKIKADDREWVSPNEAAAIMGMSSRTFRRHRNDFPFQILKVGGRYHINKKSFLEFLRTGDVNRFWRNDK